MSPPTGNQARAGVAEIAETLAPPRLRMMATRAPVSATQLDRIASLATLSNVTIGVIAMDAETSVIPWHGFTLNEDVADGEPFVQVETIHAHLTVARPEDVELYRRQYAVLRESALLGQEFSDFLGVLRAEL